VTGINFEWRGENVLNLIGIFENVFFFSFISEKYSVYVSAVDSFSEMIPSSDTLSKTLYYQVFTLPFFFLFSLI